jgi:hypothetical protein
VIQDAEIINTACELNGFEPSHHSLWLFTEEKDNPGRRG